MAILAATILLFLTSATWSAPVEVPPAAWSGDGHEVGVAASLHRGYGIHIFNTEGRACGFIAFKHPILAMKWPSSEGPLCLLARYTDGQHYLWLANPSGVIKQLCKRPVYVPSTPSGNLFDWSPDRRYVVFASDTGANVDLWHVQIEHGWEKRLTDSESKDFSPAWSPDGQRIAFCSERGGTRGIWIIPAGGGSARKVVDGPDDEEHPAWSPESNEISFLAKGKNEGIYTAAISGARRKPISVGGRDYAAPIWSSTGKWISFAYGKNPGNLFCTPVKKAKGWGPYYQTTFDRAKGVAAQLRVPAWSPVRDQLVYATLEGGALSVRVANLSEVHGPVWRNVYTDSRARPGQESSKKGNG